VAISLADIECARKASICLNKDRNIFIQKFNENHDETGRFSSSGISIAVERDSSGQVFQGGKLDKQLTLRAKNLRIPPAWTDLRMSVDPENALQATAKDAKGRSQYLYSAAHSEKAAAEKFGRIKALVEELPKIDTIISRDAPKKDEAAVLLLMRKTGIRIGSERETGADKQAYGATTLLSKHVKISGDKVTLSFVGKKGVNIHQVIEDKELASVLKSRISRGGKVFDTTDGKVRDYLHANDGKFKAKDLRTVKALEVSLSTIKKIPVPKNTRDYTKARNSVGDAVSKVLGNTRSVALASYIPPEVFSGWSSKLGIKEQSKLFINELSSWVDSIHYSMPNGKWEDELEIEWWDIPETQQDEDF
jgi:DNA topoisomerase-1